MSTLRMSIQSCPFSCRRLWRVLQVMPSASTLFSRPTKYRLKVTHTHILANNALRTCQNGDPSSSKIQTLDHIPPFDAFKDVLLIVNFNTGQYYDTVIDLYLEIYQQYFPNIVFYGDSQFPVPERFQNVVKTLNSNHGVFAYLCLIDAMETHPGYKGYLHTNDDVILNVHQLATFDQNKVWKSIPRIPLDVHPRLSQRPDRWSLWSWDSSRMWNDSSLFTPEQRERIANFTGNKGATDVRAWVDAVYIPGRLASEFTPIIHHQHQYGVHNELVIGVTLLGIEPVENWIPWHEEYLWDDSGPPERLRDHWREWLKPGMGMLHAVKLSGGSAVKDDTKHWVDTVEAVVVVADTKSPKEWKCGACVYLTVEEQQCLGFGMVPEIPFKAYTRKNIGYLWAIKQGATTVFDNDEPERYLVAPPVLIQQGLADLDPDVDAVFRLTQGQELKRIKQASVLDAHQFVERDVNGSLAFTRPTVEQIRNAHNYLDDFKDEFQLYTDTSRFVDFLANWTSASADLEARIVELMKAMAAEKFIGEADVDLAQRWAKDLQSIGYVFPKVCSCHGKADPSAGKICHGRSAIRDTFKDVLLVVNFNWDGHYDLIPTYLQIYKPYFLNIVFYGPNVTGELLIFVNPVEALNGQLSYISLVTAMEKYPGYKDYLHTKDDVVLNPRQLSQYSQDKV
ncbi:MAG: hypothetical protein BYD32DRAFT_458529 [Podila humilis]|nr:MAG: hypothetical protein BYD32DRAFT_458529 [Podila humilis]